MIKYYKKENDKVFEIQAPEKDCWINIYPPFDQQKLKDLSEELDIPFDFLTDSIDINERSRFEKDDDIMLMVINTPIKNTGELTVDLDSNYIVVPIGIILLPDMIVTISASANPVMDWFVENSIRNLKPQERGLFVLKIFEKNVNYYIQTLKKINNKRNLIEKELYDSSRNQELSKMLNLQKSLVYFLTNLRANEQVMMKVQRMNQLAFDKEDEFAQDYFQDIIIDNSQALEMASVYTNILNGTMDAFASIISNNLNNVMKRLTAVTIILMVPTLIASFYGMNVKSLPLANTSLAFAAIVFGSIILSIAVFWFFMRKRFF